MLRIVVILSLFLSMGFSRVSAQDTVAFQIQLLTPDMIGEAILDQEPFFDWVSGIKDKLHAELESMDGNFEVITLVHLTANQSPNMQLSARPDLDAAKLKALENVLEEIPPYYTKSSSYSFAFIARINEGCQDQNAPFSPEIKLPEDQEIEQFQKLSLQEKEVELRRWIDDDIMPVVLYYFRNTDPRYEGVHQFGQTLNSENWKAMATDSLTSYNPDYWRGVMEMKRGNQLMPFTKICLHIHNREYNKADRLLEIVNFFTKEETLPDYFMSTLAEKMSLFKMDISSLVNQGIELHDAGKFDEAVKLYETALNEDIEVAWLLYEHFFSKSELIDNPDAVMELWAESKQAIYTADPLYSIQVKASSGKEGYEMFIRKELKTLFNSPEEFKGDLIRYADIALDLEYYPLAAQVYWYVLSYFKEEDYSNRDLMAHFMFCIDQLGANEVTGLFEKDFTASYDTIRMERNKIMEESAVYNAFEE